MIMNTEDVELRLASPDNLINRLRGSVAAGHEKSMIPAMPIINIGQAEPVGLPPSVDTLVDDIENKLANQRALTGAAKVMADSIQMLRDRLCEVEKPTQLSRIATDMSRILNSDDNDSNKKKNNPVIIYKPVLVSESTFETVHVSE